MAEVGVPTASSFMDGLKKYGVGAIGGVTYNLAASFFGSGLIGGAVSAALAGSVVKGAQGDMIATMIGFQSGLGFNVGNIPALGAGGDDGGSVEVM